MNYKGDSAVNRDPHFKLLKA